MKEYSVLQRLPDDGQVVMCFGHKIYCCKEDMDEDAQWHEVKFTMHVWDRKLKKIMPIDPEASVLESYTVKEHWEMVDEANEHPFHILGVTKWKGIYERDI